MGGGRWGVGGGSGFGLRAFFPLCRAHSLGLGLRLEGLGLLGFRV